ncbi:hypothetical protein BV898_07322 [Hypsibius exemplaris]|uniref:F-box domain-containing protein n=1 Tax=Hypsibius exemplaris TaxID=2072580 RepID=A0A1W0WU19_HYPEX|nr:hypothetical protein BV898_07322 [Hypsibius exemplaris]
MLTSSSDRGNDEKKRKLTDSFVEDHGSNRGGSSSSFNRNGKSTGVLEDPNNHNNNELLRLRKELEEKNGRLRILTECLVRQAGLLQTCGIASSLPELIVLSPIRLQELPDEIMIEMFKHCDFTTQRRARRVSKRFNFNLTKPDVTSSVFLDTESFFGVDNNLSDELVPDASILRNEFEWKFTAPAVKDFTFNALRTRRPKFNRKAVCLIVGFAQRCTRLESLTIRGLLLRSTVCYTVWFIGVPYIVTYTASEGRNVIASLPTGKGHRRTKPLVIAWDIKNVTARPQVEEICFDNAYWPYPVEQMNWLLDCAERCTQNEGWMKWVQEVVFPDKSQEFADSLHDGTFAAMHPADLQKKLKSPVLLKLAASFVSLQDPELPPPPHRFAFQTEKFYQSIQNVMA